MRGKQRGLISFSPIAADTLPASKAKPRQGTIGEVGKEPVDRCAETDRASYVWRTSLEPGRGVCVARNLKRDRTNHVPTTLVRFH